MSDTAARWMSPSEAARALGLSSERIRQLTNEGKLAAERTPLGRLIDAEAVRARIAAKTAKREPAKCS